MPMNNADFQGLVQGLNEARTYARGEPVDALVAHIPEAIDVAKVRRDMRLTQAAFSRRMGISAATLRNWEQGRRKPEGPARVLLALIAANPRVVEDTLALRHS